MKIAGIVFDKDGTLLEIQPFWSGVVRHAAAEVLGRFGFSDCPRALFEELLLTAGLRPTGEVLPEGLVVAGTNADIARVWELVLTRHQLCVPRTVQADIRAMLGAGYAYGQVRGPEHLPQLLRDLKNRGLKLAVATSDDLAQTTYCLEQLQVLSLLSPVMTADQVKRAKPNPEMMECISRAWSLPAGELLMVGDSANDMRFAQNSGAVGVYLAESECPLPEGAIGRIGSLGELPSFLAELGAGV